MILLIPTTFQDVTIPPEETVIVLMLLEMMRKDTVVGFFPFTIPEGEYTTGLTDLYRPNSQQCLSRGACGLKRGSARPGLPGLAVSNLAVV